jgi:hypothetical protein
MRQIVVVIELTDHTQTSQNPPRRISRLGVKQGLQVRGYIYRTARNGRGCRYRGVSCYRANQQVRPVGLPSHGHQPCDMVLQRTYQERSVVGQVVEAVVIVQHPNGIRCRLTLETTFHPLALTPATLGDGPSERSLRGVVNLYAGREQTVE